MTRLFARSRCFGVLVTLVALAATPAAQARMFGLSGTPAIYRALAAMAPSVHADFVGFGEQVTPLLQADSRLHATAMITWDPNAVSLSSIAEGADDAYLKSVAQEIRSYGRPVYIRFAQEMNGNWFAWGGQPA